MRSVPCHGFRLTFSTRGSIRNLTRHAAQLVLSHWWQCVIHRDGEYYNNITVMQVYKIQTFTVPLQDVKLAVTDVKDVTEGEHIQAEQHTSYYSYN